MTTKEQAAEIRKTVIESLINRCHGTAVLKGWWENERPFTEEIALQHSELSEALEEYRNGRPFDEIYYQEDGKPEGIAAELADVLIRIFDTCGKRGIPLARALQEKMTYNESRPHRHGGKKA